MTWEYMVREFNVQDSDKILLLEEFLNETGKDGWELVSVGNDANRELHPSRLPQTPGRPCGTN